MLRLEAMPINMNTVKVVSRRVSCPLRSTHPPQARIIRSGKR
jgi:hypothetical protein